MKENNQISGIAIGGAALIICISVAAFSSYYTIDTGERGVVLSWGEIKKVSEPGLHFKMPLVEKVVRIETRTYTGKLENVLAYSKDQQPADIRLSVTLAVKNSGVGELYTQFKDIKSTYETIVVPKVQQQLKTVFGQYSAIRAVQERKQLNLDAQAAIITSLEPYPFLDIKSIQIENIDFSDAYEQTIEDRMKAEVEVEKFRQNLERERVEAEILVTKAQAEADAKVKTAEADAKAITLKSKAEADAINNKGQALRENPNITSLMQIEKWDGILPKTMLPNTAVPMLNLEEKAK